MQRIDNIGSGEGWRKVSMVARFVRKGRKFIVFAKDSEGSLYPWTDVFYIEYKDGTWFDLFVKEPK